MALGWRGRFLRLTEPARVVWSGATRICWSPWAAQQQFGSRDRADRDAARVEEEKCQSRLCGAGSPRIVWLVAHSQHGAAFSSVSS